MGASMRLLSFGGTLVVGFLCSQASFAQAPPQPAPQKAAPPAAAEASAAAEEQVTPEETKKRQDWRDSMLRKATPKKGCFNAVYPETEWQEVPCVAAPNIPATPRHGARPAVVG